MIDGQTSLGRYCCACYKSFTSAAGHVQKFTTEVLHPYVSDPPGLLLQVALAVHGVVDHQFTWPTWLMVRHPLADIVLLAILHQCSAASHVLHFDLDHRKIVRDHENQSSGLESSQILLCGFYGLDLVDCGRHVISMLTAYFFVEKIQQIFCTQDKSSWSGRSVTCPTVSANRRSISAEWSESDHSITCQQNQHSDHPASMIIWPSALVIFGKNESILAVTVLRAPSSSFSLCFRPVIWISDLYFVASLFWMLICISCRWIATRKCSVIKIFDALCMCSNLSL